MPYMNTDETTDYPPVSSRDNVGCGDTWFSLYGVDICQTQSLVNHNEDKVNVVEIQSKQET